MTYAPIVIFAFNRLDTLKNCVESLLDNEESKMSDLFVYVDGPRPQKEGEAEIVESIQRYAKNINGFRSLTCVFSDHHKGLAPSIIDGVSQVINQYGRVVVIEDDLIVSPNFLAYINEGLTKYQNDGEVFSICGYSNKVVPPSDYPFDAYFCTRSCSWGWATWKDRWNSVDWELKDWKNHKQNAHKFNAWGGSDCWKMLEDWHNGRISSWAIRFGYAQFLQKSLSLFPLVSKVENKGFTKGTHGKGWSRFKFDFDTSDIKSFRFPIRIELNRSLYKQALSYHSVFIRIWSRIMYALH